jgi:hypothetical protein
MGWADDMYSAGYTSEHGGIMECSGAFKQSIRCSAKLTEGLNGKAKNSGKPWPASARKKVVELYEESVSVEFIARQLGRTPYAIAWQLFDLHKISAFERDVFQ